MGYYIVATKNGDEVKYRPPKRASNPREAMYDRGVVPEDHDKIRVYPVRETAAGNCQYWDKEDLVID